MTRFKSVNLFLRESRLLSKRKETVAIHGNKAFRGPSFQLQDLDVDSLLAVVSHSISRLLADSVLFN